VNDAEQLEDSVVDGKEIKLGILLELLKIYLLYIYYIFIIFRMKYL
jgi:hypothetical protein